jgi:protein O-GlcNAc transferase
MKRQRHQGTADIDIALQHHRAGRLQQAEAIYKKMPFSPDALHLRGVILHQLNQHDDAVELIGKAIRANPSNVNYCFSIDPVYRALNRLDDVVTCYQSLLTRVPNNPDVHNNLGNALKDQGKLDEAVACFVNATALKPDFAEAHSNLGIALAAKGSLNDAVTHYQKAVALKPDFAEAYINLGVTLTAQGRLDEAAPCYHRAVELRPDFAEAHANLGIVLTAQGKLDDALDFLHKAIALKPDFVGAYTHLASALNTLGRLDEATACYRQALVLKPDLFEAHYNLGCALKDQGKLNEAVVSYLNALALKLDSADVYNNLGIIFAELGNREEAVNCYQTALALKDDFTDVHNNLGIVLADQGKLDDAIACYQNALALKPDFADAYSNLGSALQVQGKLDDAIACYRNALAYEPGFTTAHQNLLLAIQYSASHTPEDILAEHVRFAEQFEPQMKAHWLPHPNLRDPDKRLKIGYVSPNYFKHSVAYFTEPVLACHDRAQVEIFCYYNHKRHDHVTDRIRALADHWVPCKDMSDDQLAKQIRADGIDILIDLAGHTGGNRLRTFAMKPAPVQATYVGYPSTTGLTAMDYRIVDVHTEPPGMTERFSVEQLWRLPEIFCCYRAHENSPEVIDHPPSEDNGYITFGCFNNFAKINDPVLALWATLLHKVPTARLMLEIHGIDNPLFRAEVESRMACVGMPVERVIFVPRTNANQYVLYNSIDIALDPFPCNGGTTSMDTVWMGAPFITLAGRYFTSRMGVTILTNAGLPELIAETEDDYVEIAAALAYDAARLKTIRSGLRDRVRVSPLMDAQRFTTHMEQAYRGMWQQWCGSQAATSRH